MAYMYRKARSLNLLDQKLHIAQNKLDGHLGLAILIGCNQKSRAQRGFLKPLDTLGTKYLLLECSTCKIIIYCDHNSDVDHQLFVLQTC